MQNKDITEQNMADMPLHNYEGIGIFYSTLALHVSCLRYLRYVLSPSFSALSDLSSLHTLPQHSARSASVCYCHVVRLLRYTLSGGEDGGYEEDVGRLVQRRKVSCHH